MDTFDLKKYLAEGRLLKEEIMVDTTVMVDPRQTSLIKRLEKEKFDVAPVQLTHSRTLGGGHHCCTLDLHRG